MTSAQSGNSYGPTAAAQAAETTIDLVVWHGPSLR